MPRARHNTNATEEQPVAVDNTEVSTNEAVPQPPYEAKWISIRDAAQMAGVTSQTVRNAYSAHPSFNVPGVTDAAPTTPRWFQTLMVDQFGNVTDYRVIYLDHAAVEDWIAARANKPATGVHSGAKRRIIRLTDEQIAVQPKDIDGNPLVQLADGTWAKLEAVPVGNRKPKATGDATDNPEDGVVADNPNVQQADLFDVELEEVPA